jgi:hypothetical protein
MATYLVSTGAHDGDIQGSSFYSNQNSLSVGATYQALNLFCLFSNINIPVNATITSATISLKHYGKTANPNIRIYSSDEDNASAPTNTTEYNNKPLTTAYVNWTINDATTWYVSPDISSVIQEIVSRAGWNTNNAILLLLKNNASASYNYIQFCSYEYGAADAPILDITYTTGSDTYITCSDTLTVGITDTSSLNVALSVSDTLTVGITDTSSLNVALSVSDTLTVGITDTSSLNVALSVSEVLDINITDMSSITTEQSTYNIIVSDTLILDITDTTSLNKELDLSDSLITDIIDTLVFNLIEKCIIDSLDININDIAYLVCRSYKYYFYTSKRKNYFYTSKRKNYFYTEKYPYVFISNKKQYYFYIEKRVIP